jgi:hypothetical protein
MIDIDSIVAILQELTLDFVSGKRNRPATVSELHARIDPDDIYKMPDSVPQKAFITEVYVSLDNLVNEDFAPSFEEMQYFMECFEGKRIFSQEEVRNFTVGPFEKENPSVKPKK